MPVLAIDTSGKLPNVAVAQDGELLAHCFGEAGSSTEELPGIVSKLLSSASIDFSAIDKIIVAVGPGSFTGIRTGVAFAQGISTARESLLYGLDVVSARFALQLPTLGAGVYCATLRANKSEFFFRSFVVNGDKSLGEISEIGVVEEGEVDTKFDPATLIDLDSLDLEQRCSVGMVTAWDDEKFAGKRLFQQSCAATPLELLYVKPVHALTIAERQARAQGNNR